MKKVLMLFAAVAMAVSAEAAKTIWVDWFEGDLYHNSAYGYVDPYFFQNASSAVSFTATNTPAGWKVVDWMTVEGTKLLSDINNWTSTGVSSGTYQWTDFTSQKNRLAVRFSPISYTLSFDTAGGTAFPNAGPYLSTNVVSLAEYTGTRTGYSFVGWTNEYVTTAIDHNTPPFMGIEKFGLGNADTVVALRAAWSANTYTVSFDADGGSVSPASKSVTYDQAYGELPEPTWTGHTFSGWYSSGSSQVTAATVVNSPSNHTLTARWSTDTYNLTTACEGTGSVSLSPSSAHYAYGTEVTVTATPGTGWLFKNWKEDESTTNPRTVTMTDSISLTAVFTARVYTVTFKYRDSSKRLVSEVQNVSHGESATPPSDETVNQYPGHVFNYWSGSYSYVTDSRTVTAVYDANVYTVEFDANGSGVSGSMGGGQEFTCGVEKQLKLNKYSRVGYTFSGWNTAADGSGNPYADGELVSDLSFVDGDVVTLYAQWDPISYNIEFSGGTGSSGSMATISGVDYGAEVTLPANQFSKPGCEFKYWKCGALEIADGAAVSNLTTTAGATVTLVASWDAPYWLAFDANGGDGEMEVQRFETDEPQALDACLFERAGYTFAGWATNSTDAAALKAAYADGEVVLNAAPETATNTLYAVWSTNVYWVAFDPNGGTGDAMAPQRFIYDQAQNLSSNTYFLGELWKFGGWSNTVDGAVFADMAAVSNLCTVAGATNTLVAVWDDNRTDLSKAMHCMNLQWENVKVYTWDGNDWQARFEGGLGYEASGSCAEQTSDSSMALTTEVATNGVFSFFVRNASSVTTTIEWEINAYKDGFGKDDSVWGDISISADGEWYPQSITVDFSAHPAFADKESLYIHLRCKTSGGIVQIDQMTWTPEGSENPEPTDADRVEPESVSVDGGQMTISYTGDEKFAYHLLATDSLSPADWYPYGATNVGTGASQTLPIVIDAGHPQRFFKIRVIRKP